jgi:hypothetical protein
VSKQLTFAVDWDGTLVHYDGYKGPLRYGPPIHRMVKRVRAWLDEGHNVIIFTSRVSAEHSFDKIYQETIMIKHELILMGLPPLEITANKFTYISEFWDDRAIGVKRNEGSLLSGDLGCV